MNDTPEYAGWSIQEEMVDGTAGEDHVHYTVAEGCEDHILSAAGFHDDVAARQCLFTATLVSGSPRLTDPAEVAATGNYRCLILYEKNPMPHPLILKAGTSLNFYALSLGAGKKASMHIITARIKGK